VHQGKAIVLRATNTHHRNAIWMDFRHTCIMLSLCEWFLLCVYWNVVVVTNCRVLRENIQPHKGSTNSLFVIMLKVHYRTLRIWALWKKIMNLLVPYTREVSWPSEWLTASLSDCCVRLVAYADVIKTNLLPIYEYTCIAVPSFCVLSVRVDGSYKQEQKMASINGSRNYACFNC
jgi:hypothetical protein